MHVKRSKSQTELNTSSYHWLRPPLTFPLPLSSPPNVYVYIYIIIIIIKLDERFMLAWVLSIYTSPTYMLSLFSFLFLIFFFIYILTLQTTVHSFFFITCLLFKIICRSEGQPMQLPLIKHHHSYTYMMHQYKCCQPDNTCLLYTFSSLYPVVIIDQHDI